MLDKRGPLLLAALAFSGLRAKAGVIVVEIETLRRWLDSWPGIGAVVVGIAHQGYDLQLIRYDEQGWRVTFYTSGMEHSPTSDEDRAGTDTVASGARGGVGDAYETVLRSVTEQACVS